MIVVIVVIVVIAAAAAAAAVVVVVVVVVVVARVKWLGLPLAGLSSALSCDIAAAILIAHSVVPCYE